MNSHINAPAGAIPSAAPAQAVPARVARMSDVLRRYPSISEEEREQLLRFLVEGDREEVVRATSGSGLEPRLIAFRKDHPEHFPGFRAWLPLVLLIVVTVVGVLWRVLAG